MFNLSACFSNALKTAIWSWTFGPDRGVRLAGAAGAVSFAHPLLVWVFPRVRPAGQSNSAESGVGSGVDLVDKDDRGAISAERVEGYTRIS